MEDVEIEDVEKEYEDINEIKIDDEIRDGFSNLIKTREGTNGDDELLANEKEEEELENPGDLPGYKVTDTDKKLRSLYGDYTHRNSGYHMDGGVSTNKMWTTYWEDLVIWPSRRFDIPKGAIGHRIVEQLTDELVGIIKRKWNFERFIVFQMVLFQRTESIKSSSAIRKRMQYRLTMWREGEFDWLVKDTLQEMKKYRQTCGHHEMQ